MTNAKHLKVFLLDDNAIDREACRRHLSRVPGVKYEFQEHNSVDGALDLVQAADPDCILLDYHLHDGNGLQFLQSLVTVGGPKRYPVVMLTGTGSEVIAVEVMKIGAQDYLSKDRLSPEILDRTVQSAIYKARTERVLEEQRVEMERLFKEAQDANARKDQFLAALSHELRTPLTPVLAAVSQTDFSGHTVEDFISTFAIIRRNIEVEARLIDDMLDLTRISTGKLEIHLRRVNVHEVLRHAAEACDAERKAKNIRLEWHLTAETDELSADAGRIQQVFWNLLKNAIKFTPEGGKIAITTRDDGRQLEIEVADTGVGLKPGSADKIFDAFEQGSVDVTRRFGGLGLGLAISKALVEAHHGRISAANRDGVPGAVFTVALPINIEPRVEEEPARFPEPAVPHDASGATLLLVEDHTDSAFFLKRVLDGMGYTVLVGQSAAEGLELFQKNPVDYLISDLGLPDASGIDLMRQIAAIRPVPAIALSGYGMEGDVQRAREAGFRLHLTKPVDLPQLIAALRTLVE
jgi:signal transduction histidine kinase